MLSTESIEGFAMQVKAEFTHYAWYWWLQGYDHIHIAERPWNESLSSKIAKVQESFKNIPSMLYFSPSSVSFDGVGVYTAEALPQGE